MVSRADEVVVTGDADAADRLKSCTGVSCDLRQMSEQQESVMVLLTHLQHYMCAQPAA